MISTYQKIISKIFDYDYDNHQIPKYLPKLQSQDVYIRHRDDSMYDNDYNNIIL